MVCGGQRGIIMVWLMKASPNTFELIATQACDLPACCFRLERQKKGSLLASLFGYDASFRAI